MRPKVQLLGNGRAFMMAAALSGGGIVACDLASGFSKEQKKNQWGKLWGKDPPLV